MNITKPALAMGLSLLLTACPGERRVDDTRVVTDTPMVSPTPATTPAPAAAPHDAPPVGAQQATLEAQAGATMTGEVHALPRENSTEVWVTVHNAPPNESLGVRVHSGTCQSPGPEIARITAIGTDAAGMGQSRTDVGHAPHLIMDGNHIVGVYAPGTQPERDRPMACATLPATGAQAGQATTTRP